jgi:Threonine aldolase
MKVRTQTWPPKSPKLSDVFTSDQRMSEASHPRRHFSSDNWSGVHPEVIAAITKVNEGHVPSYGHDPYTAATTERIRKLLGESAEVFLVFSGTGANVLSLQTVALPFNTVICAETAHIYTSECGAPEKHVGCKLSPVPSPRGKIDRDGIARHLHDIGNDHHVQPSAVSISQATEYGTVYSPDEIRVIAAFAHENGMKMHMDGARLANAAAHLGVPLREISGDAGVDVLSFGGTKNGMIAGEAVVFFDSALAKNFPFRRMQAMQLSSKMRFIAAQFDALINDDLWLRSATHANAMAARLGTELATLPGVHLTQQVQANEVFATIPREHIEALQAVSAFQVWTESIDEGRFVTSFDTTEDDITSFIEHARTILG